MRRALVHSTPQPPKVWLKLERRFDSIRVTSTHPVKFAVGLRSLRGRAAKVHDELTIESTVGKGMMVSLRAPLANDLAS